jgi:hypothetical protein
MLLAAKLDNLGLAEELAATSKSVFREFLGPSFDITWLEADNDSSIIPQADKICRRGQEKRGHLPRGKAEGGRGKSYIRAYR